MEDKPGTAFISSLGNERGAHVRQVVNQAHEELLQLLEQRSDLMKRIGTLKQTIVGLANLFGDNLLSEELLDLIGDHKNKKRHAGFTDACRKILIEAKQPMSARDVCQQIQATMPLLLTHHREPLASVTTVLNRLSNYGEAEAVTSHGRRAWVWVTERAAQ